MRPYLVLTLFLGLLAPTTSAAPFRSFGSSAKTGSATAVLVEDVPLVHTTQLLPLDAQGQLIGKGMPGKQMESLLATLAELLEEAGSGLDQLVKLNLYLARPDLTSDVEKVLASRLRGSRPAVSLVVTALPHPDALVALDAVAVSSQARARDSSRVAILPAGARVYISGQAEKGKDLAESTRLTLASLGKTLQFLQLRPEDVVQVKGFLAPMSGVAAARKEVSAFFKGRVPPCSFVEWTFPMIEIELVVAAGKPRQGEPLELLTPPGMKSSPVFSRVARINRGPSIYVSGLFAPDSKDPAEEIVGIFSQLERILEDTGSDLRHLARATYYVTSDEGRRKLGEIRPRYYDPKRPPAASLAPVVGTGRAATSLTIDMIAVPAPDRPLNEYGPAEIGLGLRPEEAAQGWISLFDGKTSFGWRDAKVADGTLLAGTTSISLPRGELRAQVVRPGKLIIADKEIAAASGSFTLADTEKAGPLQLGGGLTLKQLYFRPKGMQTLWNGKDLTGWKRLDNPRLPEERRARWEVRDGRLHIQGGPGALEYQGGQLGDLVVQIGVRTRARYSNGGLFFRSIPGDLMNGYEAQLHNRCEGRDPSRPSRYSTGGIDDRQNARRLVSRDGEPFVMTVIATGPHLATWVNGYQVADWTDDRPTSPNPRKGLRLEPGTLQLQAHDPDTDYEVLFLKGAPVK